MSPPIPPRGQPYTLPDPTAPTQYQRDIYGLLRPPAFPTSPSKWEALARSAVPSANFGYVAGSASLGTTDLANREAFSRYGLRPSMLVNATRRDLGVELLGTRYPSPLLAAPIGVQKIMLVDAEDATTRACRELEVPMILSSAATRPIEQVTAHNGDGAR
jgi:lactate 2-monooxygenase